MRKIFFYIVSFCLCIAIGVSCAPAPMDTPAAIHTLETTPEITRTQTVVPSTPTSIPTPTPIPIVLRGTPYIKPVETISPQNADRLTEIARWGNGALNFIALSPDEEVFAAATTISVVLYDANTLKPKATYSSVVEVKALAFSVDGKTLAIGTSEGALLWDIAREPVHLETDGNRNIDVNSLAYSPNGKWLAAGTTDGVVIFEAVTGKLLIALDLGEVWSDAVIFSPDSKTLVEAQSYNYENNSFQYAPYLNFWDTVTWKEQAHSKEELQSPDARDPGSLCFSPDGKILAFPCATLLAGCYGLWNADKSTTTLLDPAYLLKENQYHHPKAAAFSPDGSIIAIGDDDGRIFLWDVATGKYRYTLQEGSTAINNLTFSHDGEKLYAASQDGIRLWDLETKSVVLSAINHESMGTVLSISPDSTKMATFHKDSSYSYDAVNTWDIISGSMIQTFSGWGYADIASDWSTLATLSPGEQVILLYDVESGKVAHRLARGVNQGTVGILYSPFGNVLATREAASKDKLLLWNAASGNLIRAVTEGLSIAAFSPDGESYITRTYTSVDPYRISLQYWNIKTGEKTESIPIGEAIISTGLFTQDSDTTIGSLSISPDGSSIVMTVNKVLVLWSKAEQRFIWVYLEKWSSEASFLTFSPDGKVIAAKSETSFLKGDSILLLDASTGNFLTELTGTCREIDGIAFSPDGTLLIASGENGVIDIYGVR